MSVEDPGELINRLKDDEKEEGTWTVVEPDTAASPAPSKTVTVPRERRHRRHSPSLFGPMILIAAGAYFLLRNLGVELPEPNWDAAWRLWPLFLVFGGLNMIVRQAPRALAGLLGLLTSAAFAAVFGYALFFADAFPPAMMGADRPLVREDVFFETTASAADMAIELGASGANIAAGAPAGPLIAGNVSYTGQLNFEGSTRGDTATVVLGARNSWWFGWPSAGDTEPWTLALAPDVLLDLDVDAGSGRVDLNLAGMLLDKLNLDGGSGVVDVVLPVGQYPASLDFGSGAATVAFPADGDLNVRLNGGSGAILLQIPNGLATQISVDTGSGAFSPDGRFSLVDGDREDGVWQTDGFDDAETRLVLDLDLGSGATRVVTP